MQSINARAKRERSLTGARLTEFAINALPTYGPKQNIQIIRTNSKL